MALGPVACGDEMPSLPPARQDFPVSGVLGRLFGRKPAPATAETLPAVSLFAPQTPPQTFREPPVPAEIVAPEPVSAADGAWRAWRITAAQGGWLAAGDVPAGLLHIALSLDPADAVIAIVPDRMPHLCLLLAPDARPLQVQADPMRAVAVSARILPTDARGAVRLKYPLGAANFLTLQDQALRFDGDGNTLQAVFGLTPVDAADVTADARRLANEIARAASCGLRAAPVLALLRTGSVRPGLAAPLIRAMPRDELDELARRLVAQASDLAMLGRAMPDDRWMREILPALAAWLPARPPVPGHSAGSPATDEAELLPAAGTGLVPAGLALTALARRQVLPRRGACILAAARNEGPYLLDWISYHLSIGFEHIFLYSNENTDGSDALLDLLAGHGIITLMRNARSSSLGPQIKATTHASTMLPQILDFRWAALLDLDEYLAFDTRIFATVGDFIAVQESQPVDAIALCWLVYAALPEDRWSDASTLIRCPRRLGQVQALVKSLVRPGKFWLANPHFPTAVLDDTFDFRSADGRIHHHPYRDAHSPSESAAPAADQAWVNHYLFRTAGEALWKWARGRGDLAASNPDSMRSLDFIADGFLNLARPEHLVHDARIIECARGQGAMLDSLLRLPGVAACDAEIKAAFKWQLAKTAQAFLAEASGHAHFREFIEEGLLS